MFAGIEAFFHRIRRRLSRNEWAVRHLGLTPSEGTSEEPGLLLLQIDGLSRKQLEAAIAKGRMPYLRRLLRRDGYELHTFYPGLPSTTPAVQAELHYGIKSAVPAFSFFDRTLKKLGRMWDPEWAKAREAGFAHQAEGLLKGGSSWSNIYTGGASQEESHFCAASIGLGDMWRSGKFGNVFLFLVLQLPAAVKIFWRLLVELVIGVPDAIQAIARGRRLKSELVLLVSRVFVGVGLRELLTIGGQIEVTRGLPIVHINFVGYDEHAHLRGPNSRLAHFGLRGIDHAIRKIALAAHHSRRRDYAVWIFSDHGQETTRAFSDAHPGGVEALLLDCLEASKKRDRAWRAQSQERPMLAAPWLTRSRRQSKRYAQRRAAETLTFEEGKPVLVAAMGPVGHAYFATPMTDEQRLALARRLVAKGVPGVLIRFTDGQILWLHAAGETPVPNGVSALLTTHPPEMRDQIARDLVEFCETRDAGDLIVLGWSPDGAAWSFASERGAHGGFGPEETRGFALLPARTPLPGESEAFIRPSALRAAALHYLGRTPLSRPHAWPARPRALRLMTYNVHGCSGMDGRVSPRRVARVIAAHAPDVVALQEVDLGRRRSRTEDQAALIGQQIGMHAVFCPTITRGNEHYGHAFFSRWPVEIVKRALLPHDPKSWWQEPRSALWVRVHVDGLPVNILTTHLGLGRYERLLQMQMLLGPEWVGKILDEEIVLLCGDFNLTPGSKPYGLAATRLRDVQAARQGHRPLLTFSSMRPFARLDHIFISKSVEVQQVLVPRSELTRVASDHLPLIADLSLVPANVEMPTRTPA
jgi:endonuclease/exonuclease/phosphatase family metal-dependent hydrolase